MITWVRTCNFAYRATIRLLDVIVASIILIITAPLLVLIALLIRFESPGPALFRHQRVGMNRTPFIFYKFRTMYVDARQRFPELYAYEYSDEELYTLPIKLLVGPRRDPELIEGPIEEFGSKERCDPRVTRIGRWLRRTSLDELPNFWNVLKGDMHLVGPRPDIEENVRYYSPRHLQKLVVKPGITGLAQVRGRGNLSFHETNELDVEYVEKQSLALDVWILLKTILVSLKREGAF
jgi:lipopolysaccharide/colanic/teichoic acid biosynthesis glycosyltransferase